MHCLPVGQHELDGIFHVHLQPWLLDIRVGLDARVLWSVHESMHRWPSVDLNYAALGADLAASYVDDRSTM